MKKEKTLKEITMEKLFYGVKDIEIILDCSHGKAQQLKNKIESEIVSTGKKLFSNRIPKNIFWEIMNKKFGLTM